MMTISVPGASLLVMDWARTRRNMKLALALSLLLPLPSLAQAGTAHVSDLAVTASDGRTVKLSDYDGKWLLVNYWATWCESCVAELPELSKLATEKPGVAVLGLTDEEITPQKMQAFLAVHPVAYPIALVDRKSLPPELPDTVLGLQMRPVSYLISPDGKVAKRFVGTVHVDQLKLLIAEHKS